ncbi:hypothetical protein COO60DRAFT_580123 [Scenedesmus sp. NREL 46B-D3]|nr:hypothetical protein COO60DRAFT_580123 [Scenedesmus sp. NREL 46B-D3]
MTSSAAPSDAAAAAPSRAKLLAQALAKKEIVSHSNLLAAAASQRASVPVAASAAAAAAAVAVAPQGLPDMPAAAGGYAMSDQLYAGSQAQSDSLIGLGSSGTDEDSQGTAALSYERSSHSWQQNVWRASVMSRSWSSSPSCLLRQQQQQHSRSSSQCWVTLLLQSPSPWMPATQLQRHWQGMRALRQPWVPSATRLLMP